VSILKFLTFVLLVMRGALVVLSFFAGNGWFLVFYASHLGTFVVSVRSTQPTHTTLTLYEYKLSYNYAHKYEDCVLLEITETPHGSIL
jgi:hypothetical protein